MTRIPGYWQDETSGGLRPAVEAYLAGEQMTGAQIAAMRAYFRQWMAADWPGNVERLRKQIDGLTSRAALDRWIDLAHEQGIDPL